MILADKIVSLRKKSGWSQEELAEQLHVSRQSVSKWEGAQSIPDMDKIVQMSRIFGVTTDFLLKDELEEDEHVSLSPPDELRHITMEEASAYLALRKKDAPKLAAAAFLCIISPVVLLLLAALSELPEAGISENAAGGIGLGVLMIFVAVGVALFLSCAARVKDYEFLEKEPFETEYGVTGMVKERKREYRDTYTRLNIIGTVLCILSVIPLFLAVCVSAPDFVYVCAVCALLFLVGLGCIAFIRAGTYQSAMERLLEEGDYTRTEKAHKGVKGAVSLIYWLVVTAAFLFFSFGPYDGLKPKNTWIIWAIGGVLYAAVMAVVGLIQRPGSGNGR